MLITLLLMHGISTQKRLHTQSLPTLPAWKDSQPTMLQLLFLIESEVLPKEHPILMLEPLATKVAERRWSSKGNRHPVHCSQRERHKQVYLAESSLVVDVLVNPPSSSSLLGLAKRKSKGTRRPHSCFVAQIRCLYTEARADFPLLH